MAVIVPIGDFAEILFDNSEDIPNNIYIEFMNMLKQYHEYGDNSNEIHEYIRKFDFSIQIKLKKYLIKTNCCTNCCNNINCDTLIYCKLLILIIVIFGVFAMIFYFNITEKPKYKGNSTIGL